MDLKNKRILVTGGNGFVGQEVVEELNRRGCINRCAPIVPRSAEWDLRERSAVHYLLRSVKPHIIIHLAAVCGGIGANQAQPGRFFYDNIKMGIELMDEARLQGVEKFVQIGTVCSYPKFTPVPFREEDIWNGYPEETNAPYGLAKKTLLVMAQSYRKQYGSNFIYIVPVNLYGPRDNFDPQTSHVIPGLIRQIHFAKKNGGDITLWGSGAASREFLHVRDCARGIILATEKYDGAEPVNLGVGEEITIRELAAKLAKLMGFQGKINYDLSKPDGQPRRCLDISKAENLFGFKANIGFDEGLAETVQWFEQEQK